MGHTHGSGGVRGARPRPGSTMEPVVDLSLHPPRPHAELLLLANHMVASTVEQLNTFGGTAERKLLELHEKMGGLEVEVRLLEFKLGTIDGSDAAQPPAQPTQEPAAGAAGAADPAAGDASDAAAPPASAPAEEPAQPRVKDDPRCAKFFKMVGYGVPIAMIRDQFATETGLDPDLLDTPDAPAPP